MKIRSAISGAVAALALSGITVGIIQGDDARSSDASASPGVPDAIAAERAVAVQEFLAANEARIEELPSLADETVTNEELDQAFRRTADCVASRSDGEIAISHHGAGDLSYSIEGQDSPNFSGPEGTVEECMQRWFDLPARVYALEFQPTVDQRATLPDCSDEVDAEDHHDCVKEQEKANREIAVENADAALSPS